MAEFLGIPYVKIATCAIVPALFYDSAVGTMVHLEAVKNGLLGLPRHMLPKIMVVLKERGLLVGPLLVIIYLLISGRSPFLAAYWGILFSVAIGQVHIRTMPFLVPILLATPPVLFDFSPLQAAPGLRAAWLAVGRVGLVITFRRSDRLTWVLGVLTSGLLAGLLFSGVETSLSAFWTTMAVVAIGMCYKESKMRIPDLMDALHWGTKNALAIGAACACVGFIVGATTLTGLGLKFAATVLKLATNVVAAISYVDILHLVFDQDAFTLFFTLVFTALACFILGMGTPSTANIVASMIAAPALLQWHILPLVSHMFVFYYSILADVTPPVALAAYAASGISGADPFRTGLRAFTLSSGGFIHSVLLRVRAGRCCGCPESWMARPPSTTCGLLRCVLRCSWVSSPLLDRHRVYEGPVESVGAGRHGYRGGVSDPPGEHHRCHRLRAAGRGLPSTAREETAAGESAGYFDVEGEPSAPFVQPKRWAPLASA